MRAPAGFLLVDKAKGPTSHDVVQAVRALAGERRCGHTGTLDPFATGLLPVGLGRATRLARFLSGAAKTYWAVVRFGFATDTYDATGRPVGPLRTVRLDPAEIAVALCGFVGKQEQTPPPFAAKKLHGQRMYRLARNGVPLEPRPVPVVVRRISLLGVEVDRATIEAEVESGTYIRSLAHDLGRKLGTGAHLEELRRTRVGALVVERAMTLESLEAFARAGRLPEQILGPSEALSHLPVVHLSEAGVKRARHGNPVEGDDAVGPLLDVPEAAHCRLLAPDGVFVAVAAVEGARRFRPVVVLAPAGSDPREASVASGFTPPGGCGMIRSVFAGEGAEDPV